MCVGGMLETDRLLLTTGSSSLTIASLFITLCSSPFPSTIGTRRLRGSLHSLDPSAARLIQTSTLCHPREYPLVLAAQPCHHSPLWPPSVPYLCNSGSTGTIGSPNIQTNASTPCPSSHISIRRYQKIPCSPHS